MELLICSHSAYAPMQTLHILALTVTWITHKTLPLKLPSQLQTNSHNPRDKQVEEEELDSSSHLRGPTRSFPWTTYPNLHLNFVSVTLPLTSTLWWSLAGPVLWWDGYPPKLLPWLSPSTISLGSAIRSHGFSYHCYGDDTKMFLFFPPWSDTHGWQTSLLGQLHIISSSTLVKLNSS